MQTRAILFGNSALTAGPFYGMSFGNFSGGGQIAVEYSAKEVALVDTFERMGKVDGR